MFWLYQGGVKQSKKFLVGNGNFDLNTRLDVDGRDLNKEVIKELKKKMLSTRNKTSLTTEDGACRSKRRLWIRSW